MKTIETLALFLTLFLFFCQEVSGAQCTPIEENIDYIGNDIKETQQSSAEKCCNDCKTTPGCSVYVWVNRFGVGTCILKSQAMNRSPYQGARAGKVFESCAPVAEDTDYPGFDIGEPLKLASMDLCCGACSRNESCAAFVWVLRDDVGTCLLKYERGDPSPFPGAKASYLLPPSIPTPTPTNPLECAKVEIDVDYGGFDITSTDRSDFNDCCYDCENTIGCSLFVWSNYTNTCWLKSKKGDLYVSPGARAGVLPIKPPQTPLAPIEEGRHGSDFIPNIVFQYIKGAQWIEQGRMNFVVKRANEFIQTNFKRNHSLDEGLPKPVLGLEAELGVTAYVNVTSSGECAAITGAFNQYFFTYAPSHELCLTHLHSADGTTQMLKSKSDKSISIVQTLPETFVTEVFSATNTECLQACTEIIGCAGYAHTSGNCLLYMPKSSSFSTAIAGWVNQASYYIDRSTVQFQIFEHAKLPSVYVQTQIRGTSIEFCAKQALERKKQLFGYNSTSKFCLFYVPAASTIGSLRFIHTSQVSVVIPGNFGNDVTRKPVPATTMTDCYKSCLPSANQCFAITFEAASKRCTQFAPQFDAALTLGWIVPKTLPDKMPVVKQVDMYVTAHQDDHELFMSSPIHRSLQNATTKTVFVYLSAGDAGQTDGWVNAREVGTLAATQSWIQLFGLYSSLRKVETALLSGHHVAKITIGNAVHYFLRLTEGHLGDVLLRNLSRAPLDQPNEGYGGRKGVRDVLQAILLAEATKVPKVTVGYSKFLQDEGEDHVLHVASGNITAEMLNNDVRFSSCVSQIPFFGYQRWYSTVNMFDREAASQRAAWLQMSIAIQAVYNRNIWSDHSMALGRTYTHKPLVKDKTCTF